MTTAYSVTCQCGKTHPVTATQAGSTLFCDCNRPIDVPLLSALRRAAGQTPIPLSTIETIQQMIARGELPTGELCPHSGRKADTTIYFHVQCERKWVRASRDSPSAAGVLSFMMIFGLIFGAVIGLLATRGAKKTEELGRDISIELPLRISSEVSATILATKNQRKLKTLLQSTPIFSALLEEYPTAFVSPSRMG